LRFPYCTIQSKDSTLAEQWNGNAWTVQSTPETSVLFGVSCPTVTDCIAVGGNGAPVAEQWKSGTWTAQTIPGPAPGALPIVTCTAATNCIAVGNGTGAALAEWWNGTGWVVQSAFAPQGPALAQLMGVSCPTPTGCIATGTYTQFTGAGEIQAALSEDWNGTSWQQQPMTYANIGSLSGVSCPTATNCTAVGPGNPIQDGPAADAWGGTGWSPQFLPLVGPDRGVPTGISCLGSFCMAVGYGFNYDQPGADVPIGWTWNGSTWTQASPTVPAAANTGGLLSVSCPTTIDCIAVGYEGVSDPFAESWNGLTDTWTIQTIPGSAALAGVSCPTTDLCWAVGGNGSIGAEEWNGSTWTLQSLPTPQGATSTSLTGISCPSASDCVAVGSYTNSQGSVITLAEQWTGSWSIMATPNPPGSIASYLSGVSCPTVRICTAVGYDENTSYSDAALAEMLSS
jgi:hypothetical protein